MYSCCLFSTLSFRYHVMTVTYVTRQTIKIYCNLTTSKTKHGMICKVMTWDGVLSERRDELFAKSCCHIKCHILKCDAVKIHFGSLSATLQSCPETEKSSSVLLYVSLPGSLYKIVMYLNARLVQSRWSYACQIKIVKTEVHAHNLCCLSWDSIQFLLPQLN